MVTISKEGLQALKRWCKRNDEVLSSHLGATRAGMLIAFYYPEYAQAFIVVFEASGLTEEMGHEEADEFVRNVPLEGLLSSNGSN